MDDQRGKLELPCNTSCKDPSVANWYTKILLLASKQYPISSTKCSCLSLETIDNCKAGDQELLGRGVFNFVRKFREKINLRSEVGVGL